MKKVPTTVHGFRDFDHDGLCTRSQRQGTAERCEEVSQGLNESAAEAIEKRRRTVENLRPELLLQGQWLDESSMLMPWFRRGIAPEIPVGADLNRMSICSRMSGVKAELGV